MPTRGVVVDAATPGDSAGKSGSRRDYVNGSPNDSSELIGTRNGNAEYPSNCGATTADCDPSGNAGAQ
jgi:hypothetical protein